MSRLVHLDAISQKKTLNIQNKKAGQSTYAPSLLRFNRHKFRKELGINWGTNNDFLGSEFCDIIAFKLEITKQNSSPIFLQFR